MTKHRAYDDPHHSDPEPEANATEPGPDQGEQKPYADLDRDPPANKEPDPIAAALATIDAKIIASLGGGPPGSGIAALLGTCAAQLMGVAR
jgi:hypothetical protein